MRTIASVAGIATLLATCIANADCSKNSERVQIVHAQVGAKEVARWEDTEIHRISPSQGQTLGIRVEPATAENYRELFERAQRDKRPAMPEVVRVSLYDISTEPPTLRSYSWAGANSLQFFGKEGAPDEIRLTLFKPVCVTKDSAAVKE